MKECILALDLGMKTGWAVRSKTGEIYSGTTQQLKRKGDDPRMKWRSFLTMLNALHARHEIGVVYYEEVRMHQGTQAAHVYGSYQGLLQLWTFDRDIEMHGLGVGTIKKFWTGTGNANKILMQQESKKRGFVVRDHNEADALAILHLGIKEND